MNKTRWQEAKKFIIDFYQETDRPSEEAKARLAWRNSNRCIGRLFWQTLHVFDERAVQSEMDVFRALERHIDFAHNDGKIRPAITVFRPDQQEKEIRIWNHQLLRYAGYEHAGDPHSRMLTKKCESLGWQGRGGDFDLLPWVVK